MDKLLQVAAGCQNAAMGAPSLIDSFCCGYSSKLSCEAIPRLWLCNRTAVLRLSVASNTSTSDKLKNARACLGGSMDSGSATESAPLDATETAADQSPATQQSYYPPTLWKNDFIESLKGDYKESTDEEKINDLIEKVRNMFRTMGDGTATTASAYDTAWVARVPALNGSGAAQFPLTIQWIIDNQLEDGSWGETTLFLAYDRIFNTLACVLALITWKVGEEIIKRGVAFIAKHIEVMKDEATTHMPSGFELSLISMLEEAEQKGLELPYDVLFINSIRQAREKKLQRIPIDYFHSNPSTILYTLEGLQSLVDWNRILNLQSNDGSFLSSPASTACVLMHTGNQKCLDFLNSILPKFDNAVPCHYPLDLFERLWAVDGLMRLGVDRFFQKEIREALDYVYKYWTEAGIGWASESPVHDLDDTCMGFRLLRLHGYDVSPRESHHGVTEMLNLNRASQIRFPGETILEESHAYSKAYLANALQNKDTFDKWAVKKDLKGEAEYALKYPWHRSLPRLEARNYIEQYGPKDVWLGKTMYRMYNVNNNTFLDLARADFNRCQSIHQKELQQINRWWNQSGFTELSFTRQRPAEIYFSIAACMFEPKFAALRLAYTKTACIIVILDDLFDIHGSVADLKLFLEAVKRWDPSVISGLSVEMKVSFNGLYDTLNSLVEDAFEVQGQDISHYLRASAEKDRGELASSISCYMNENPDASEEDAKAHIYRIINHALKELNRELVRPNNVPLPCKRLLFDSARIMQLVYMVRDGFTMSHKEMKGHLQKILFEPISVQSL
ncbi:hypothetical protein O6H91_06G087100 [Diphasiastrum complanatum]|uniref:Uncharacterized protein n=1 Tax=Diphasiastrum complanatum TaxID=34168 RepID=A0ACC2DG79_DIPCM|nr:hypothetical protein O6H91_06G087100 [Diphasiastrum complanatum]